jgi:hypothetical protein
VDVTGLLFQHLGGQIFAIGGMGGLHQIIEFAEAIGTEARTHHGVGIIGPGLAFQVGTTTFVQRAATAAGTQFRHLAVTSLL